MYYYRRQMMLISIITICIALLLTIFLLLSYVPLIALLIIFVLSLSQIADACLSFIHFHQKEAIIQLCRGLLLLLLFGIMFIHFLLQ